MGLFNLFSKSSRSVIHKNIFLLRDNILNQLSKRNEDVSSEKQILLKEYEKYISTILSGAMIKVKYKMEEAISNDDIRFKEIFQTIFIESIKFQEAYIINDKIEYDILAHKRIKDRKGLLLEVIVKYDRYCADFEHGLKTKESYYFEEFDDPDAEFSGYKNHFLFLRDLIFIEPEKTSNGIRIKLNDYSIDWDFFDEFFPFLLQQYQRI